MARIFIDTRDVIGRKIRNTLLEVLKIVLLKVNKATVARLADRRWTKTMLEWRPRHEAYKSRGRPPLTT